MTPRQTRFVAEYAACGNAAEAARRAGYSARSARVNGPRLLSNAAVREALLVSQREAAQKLELERQDVLQGLLDAVEAARLQGDAAAMIRGWSEIGRLMGFYAPERQIKIHANIAAKRVIDRLETLSDAELLKLVEAGEGAAR